MPREVLGIVREVFGESQESVGRVSSDCSQDFSGWHVRDFSAFRGNERSAWRFSDRNVSETPSGHGRPRLQVIRKLARLTALFLFRARTQTTPNFRENFRVSPRTIFVGRGEKGHTFSFTKKRPVLPRADFVLTKDPKWPYEEQFCGKKDREGSCNKAAGGGAFARTKSALSRMGHFLSVKLKVWGWAPSPLSGHHSLFSIHAPFPQVFWRSFTGSFRNKNAEFTQSLLCSLFTI